VVKNKYIICFIVAFVYSFEIIAQPIISNTSHTGNVTGVMVARWRGFSNSSTNINGALYLGNKNLGNAADRVTQVITNGYTKPSINNRFSFKYKKADDSIMASYKNEQIKFINISTKIIAPGNLCKLNYMQIFLRNTAATATGTVTLHDLVLDGINIPGVFIINGNASNNWFISNYDFSQGFNLTGQIDFSNGVYATSESGKLEITVGEREPIQSIALPLACPGDNIGITLGGLLPSKTYSKITYTVGSTSYTTAVTTNSLGFATVNLPTIVASNIGQLVVFDTLIQNCAWKALLNNTLTIASNTVICPTPLPVELLDFNAMCNENNIEFKWQTATELNNTFFTIQQSLDGINYNQIAKIIAIGNASQKNNYTYTHPNQLYEYAYYKLNQTDINNTTKTIAIIDNICKSIKDNVIIYPNPSSGFVSIKSSRPLPNLEIYNNLGQLIFNKEANTELEYSLNLAVGIYYVKITGLQNRKLVVAY
jgi:Secretion system C-terminal sorting domain